MKSDKKLFCTLKDVAAEAGVSYATVSNYLNRRELLNKKTADRVRKAISKLKYRPAVTARHLKMQETNIMGIIVPDIVNNYFATVTKTVEEIMRKNGFETVIYNTNYLEDEEEKALEALMASAKKAVEPLLLQFALDEWRTRSSTEQAQPGHC